jgi:hypothetical protein
VFSGVLLVSGSALFLSDHKALLASGMILGALILLIGIGLGWSIPTIRSELWLRSVENPQYSDDQLERLTSIRHALLVNVPVSTLLIVASVMCLYLFKKLFG